MGDWSLRDPPEKIFGGLFAGCTFVKLAIQRRDGEPIHDWRDLQAIKNQLVGPQYEAFELYPAEDRVVDTQNQFHLFVLTVHNGQDNPLIPVGWMRGCRQTQDELRTDRPWARQRDFPLNPAAAT
jgi:hypothetical protein